MAMGTNVGAASAAEAAELYGRDTSNRTGPRRLALAARSLSLELARQRHRLAAQLVNAIVNKNKKSTTYSSTYIQVHNVTAQCIGSWQDYTERNKLSFIITLVHALFFKNIDSHTYMFWQKRKVKESIPEEILESTRSRSVENRTADREGSRSLGASTESACTQISNPNVRKKKLNWVINMIVETIEESIECEPVTLKIKTPKVRRVFDCR